MEPEQAHTISIDWQIELANNGRYILWGAETLQNGAMVGVRVHHDKRGRTVSFQNMESAERRQRELNREHSSDTIRF